MEATDTIGVQDERTGSIRLDQFVGIPGYVHGLRQPSLQFRLRTSGPYDENRLAPADAWIKDTFAGVSDPPAGSWGDPFLDRLFDWTHRILESRHQPAFEPARLINGGEGIWLAWHPCLSFEACRAAISLAGEIMNASLAAAEGDAEGVRQSAEEALGRYDTALNHARLFGFNPMNFARAAHALNIPWQRFSDRVLQIGVGAASHLLESSMTDDTPIIGSMFARDKARSAKIMRQGGVPVADHHGASSPEQALAAAERLGYPVVVKPADADGGDGVTAYLHSASAVERAFAKARECSKRVLVEKHVDGTDYRFHVVHGSVIGVLERSPGSVVGDGRRTVRELVEAQNHERRTATDDRRHLHPIELDEEATTILTDTGKSWETVPAAGEKLRLRGAASVSRGGIPRELDLAEVHPDNLALAVRAARLLRLDIAGIDLLLPAIGTSWLTAGASICEVNAAPSMFTTFYEPTLRRVMRGGDGRVPVVVVLSPSPREELSGAIHAQLCGRGLTAGLAGAGGAFLGSTRPFATPLGTYDATVALTRDPALEALVIAVSDGDIMRNGWPVDHCDALVLVRGADGDPAPEAAHEFGLTATLALGLKPDVTYVDAGDATCSAPARSLRRLQPRAFGKAGEALAVNRLAGAIVDKLLS